jgi:hypothetical protein
MRLYQRRSKYFTLCSSHLYRFWIQDLFTSTDEHQGHWAVQNTKEGIGNNFLSILRCQSNRMCFVKRAPPVWTQHTARNALLQGVQNYVVVPNLKQKKKTKLKIRKAIGDRLQAPSYLSRVHHHWKIRARKQRTDIGKYSFVNRSITDCIRRHRQ